ncbi:6080_t:CDS:1 [Ambispora leptoticha]|uniref:6080_t:CDS:1 n=1 Tax=Ambispora leptoticha TaxID=144679 RepID=A0A9N9FPQ0_9GLOM|nr:6080_t:CDS:1 [Ambispora leptoticha]
MNNHNDNKANIIFDDFEKSCDNNTHNINTTNANEQDSNNKQLIENVSAEFYKALDRGTYFKLLPEIITKAINRNKSNEADFMQKLCDGILNNTYYEDSNLICLYGFCKEFGFKKPSTSTTPELFSSPKDYYHYASDHGNNKYAKNFLARNYRDGTGGAKINLHQAFYWAKESAALGFTSGQYNLGYCYIKGIGVAPSNELALYWFKEAAKVCNAMAEYNVGFCYRNGFGTEVDMFKASYWYHRAASHDDGLAQFVLAGQYHKGKGVNRDVHSAIRFGIRAVKNGQANTRYALYTILCNDLNYF